MERTRFDTESLKNSWWIKWRIFFSEFTWAPANCRICLQWAGIHLRDNDLPLVGFSSVCVCALRCFSHASNSVQPLWAVAHQNHLSIGFSRQEYWNECPCPFPETLPTQGSNPHLLCLLHWQAGYTWTHGKENQDEFVFKP